MGNALLLFNISRPRWLIELSNMTQTASPTLVEDSRCLRIWRTAQKGSWRSRVIRVPSIAAYCG